MKVRVLFYLFGLRNNLHVDRSQLLETQRKKLCRIVKHAYDNVPFYHRKFAEAGVKPDDIKSVNDLHKLPFTTKEEIQAAPPGDLLTRNIRVNNCVKRTTSGSTGLPLTIVVDRARVDFEEALWLRAFFENGLRIRDKMAVVTDPRNFPERKGFFHRLGFLRTEYFSVFDEPARLATALRVCKPDVLKGFPSSLALLAEEFGKKDDFRSRLVFTCAELLDQASRDRISLISGRGLLDYYSCSEFNLLGWECRAHEGYHINVDSTVVEFVRAGEAVTSGERGEIVCTNLSNLSMPLIRYKTGDVGIPSEEQCSCGITLPLMKLIEGRTGDFLTATDSRKISPIIFFPYPFDNEDSYKEINQFRVIQKKRDEITIQLVVGERVLSDEQLENASKKIQKVFGIDMRVNFEFVKKMPIDPSGKLKKIVSWVSTKQ